MVCKLELLKDETEGVVWVEVKLEDEGKVAVGVANLQPTMPDQLSGATANSQDGVRLDISANGVWDGRFEKTFFDVRVFNPHAPSNRNQTPSACYRKHEREKKRAYAQRILEVEHSSFTPLVFSATGGMGREATCFYKRLASMFTQKWDHPYSTTLCWLRRRLTFSLIRSAMQSLRGARSSQHHAVHSPAAIDLAVTESHITPDFLNPLFHLNFPFYFFCANTRTIWTVVHRLLYISFICFQVRNLVSRLPRSGTRICIRTPSIWGVHIPRSQENCAHSSLREFCARKAWERYSRRAERCACCCLLRSWWLSLRSFSIKMKISLKRGEGDKAKVQVQHAMHDAYGWLSVCVVPRHKIMYTLAIIVTE